MLKEILNCKKCKLYSNQKPLLDIEKKSEIMWVGLSAKEVTSDIEGPLSIKTNSGKILREIEEELKNKLTYKTNLVKCLPLDEENKIRYPTKKEIDCCLEHLLSEIKIISPKIIFLLGEKVYKAVAQKMKIDLKKWDEFKYYYDKVDGIYYIPIHHPSYIHRTKKKNMKNYVDNVKKLVLDLLSDKSEKIYLVTGAAGFIGANFLKYILKKHKDIKVIVVDFLTYAGNLGTIKEELKDSRVKFEKVDIRDRKEIERIFSENKVDYVVNFAAESHVDRSIENPQIFLETNILGTQNLLDNAKKAWTVSKDENGYPIYREDVKFLQISTDEVYGSLSKDYDEAIELVIDDEDVKKVVKNRKNLKTYGNKFFTENSPVDPRSPYSASKTGADHIVIAYGETYKLPINITRCSNNYGSYHFPEKLIPLMIKNILEGKKLPVYGKGDNVRDWLYVEDHCKGIDLVLRNAKVGEVYNIGGFNEEKNINIVKLVIDILKEEITNNDEYKKVLKTDLSNINYDLITYVQDRLGHDMRYAIDPSKIAKDLGWYPETDFETGIRKTVKWYLENQEWVNEVASGDYQKYYEEMYGNK